MEERNKLQIEQLVIGCRGFGRKIACIIDRNDRNIDQICVKINLPPLPHGLQYKDNILTEFRLEFAGKPIMLLHEQDLLSFVDLVSSPDDHLVQYVIDCRSVTACHIDGSEAHEFPEYEVRLYLECTHLCKILTGQAFNMEDPELKKIEMEDLCVFVN